MKKVPIRRCLACRGRSEKSGLLRLVWADAGSLEWDRSGKAQRRGAYLHPMTSCAASLVDAKRVGAALRLGDGTITKEHLRALRERFREEGVLES
jgi:predicted RNA-binding protein YlxR (DUF448 family)